MQTPMRLAIVWALVSLAGFCPTGLVAAEGDWKLPAERTELAAGVGRELVLGQCLLCHSTDYISTQPKLTRAQWQAAVEKMRVRYGAPLQTNSVPPLLDYLTAAYGKPASGKP
jgi:sulfite dehydrogenase (cytochrome) subunit B